MINFESAHGFGAVGDHACEVVALCLLAAEGLAFHGLGGNRSTPGKHGIMELGGDFCEVRLDQLALVIGQRISWCAHRLVFADRKHLHLDACLVDGGGTIHHRLHHADGADLRGWGGVNGAGLRSHPVGSRAHQPGGKRIDGLALIQ